MHAHTYGQLPLLSLHFSWSCQATLSQHLTQPFQNRRNTFCPTLIQKKKKKDLAKLLTFPISLSRSSCILIMLAITFQSKPRPVKWNNILMFFFLPLCSLFFRFISYSAGKCHFDLLVPVGSWKQRPSGFTGGGTTSPICAQYALKLYEPDNCSDQENNQNVFDTVKTAQVFLNKVNAYMHFGGW